VLYSNYQAISAQTYHSSTLDSLTSLQLSSQKQDSSFLITEISSSKSDPMWPKIHMSSSISASYSTRYQYPTCNYFQSICQPHQKSEF